MAVFFDALWQLMQQGAFFSVFLFILLISNGLVVFFYRRNTVITLRTAARRAQEKHKQLEERSEMMKMMLDHIPDPIVFRDPEGGYAYCNKALELLWGLKCEEILGSSPEKLFPMESDDINRIDAEVRKEGHCIKSSKWLTDKTGKKRYFEILQMPFDGFPDKGSGVLVFFNDMTKIKEELTSLSSFHDTLKRDLQERALFYSQFLRKAVHPLESIQKNTDYVLDLVRDNDEARNSLRIIAEAGHLMDSYIRNLAFLAFPDKSALASRFSAREMLSLEDWQHELKNRCQIFSMKSGKPTYILLYGDVPENLKINYSILNDLMDRLIDNAERFSTGGFYIMIRIYRVEEGYYSMNISIRNPGQSIPQAMREEIFKPFIQLNKDDGSRHAGLGLTVARQLAEKLGGSLSCDPSCSDGARFLLSLPPMGGDGTIISGHRLEGHCREWPSSVLIADDDRIFRERLGSQLKNTGLTVILAEDGYEAREMALSSKPELLMIDSKMPGLNGMEVLEEISGQIDFSKQDVYLLVSGYNPEFESCPGDHESGIGTLVKPLDWSLLLDILVMRG